MDFFLWSCTPVGRLIEQEYGIKLRIRSLGKYPSHRDFTPQKLIKHPYEQNPQAMPG